MKLGIFIIEQSAVEDKKALQHVKLISTEDRACLGALRFDNMLALSELQYMSASALYA